MSGEFIQDIVDLSQKNHSKDTKVFSTELADTVLSASEYQSLRTFLPPTEGELFLGYLNRLIAFTHSMQSSDEGTKNVTENTKQLIETAIHQETLRFSELNELIYRFIENLLHPFLMRQFDGIPEYYQDQNLIADRRPLTPRGLVTHVSAETMAVVESWFDDDFDLPSLGLYIPESLPRKHILIGDLGEPWIHGDLNKRQTFLRGIRPLIVDNEVQTLAQQTRIPEQLLIAGYCSTISEEWIHLFFDESLKDLVNEHNKSVEPANHIFPETLDLFNECCTKLIIEEFLTQFGLPQLYQPMAELAALLPFDAKRVFFGHNADDLRIGVLSAFQKKVEAEYGKPIQAVVSGGYLPDQGARFTTK